MRRQSACQMTILVVLALLLTVTMAMAKHGPTAPTAIVCGPSPAYCNTDLTATASGAVCADGSPVASYQYAWLKVAAAADAGKKPSKWSSWGDGKLACAAGAFVLGGKWQVKARALDSNGTAGPEYVCPDLIAICNCPPTAPTTVKVTPAKPSTFDNLTCEASGATDVDGDAVSYEYKWQKFVGNAWVDAGTGATVDNLATAGNEQWRACAKSVAAGLSCADWVASAAVAIADTPPTAPTSVIITPTSPRDANKLTATASGSTDGDGDALTYRYAWWKSTDQGLTWTQVATTRVIAASLTAVGEQWKACARANDGTLVSPWTYSVVVTIGASAGGVMGD